MAAKPVTLPLWATTGTITVPSGGKQAIGWVFDEKPPADYLNWYQHLTYTWIQYLDTFEGEAHTWTAINTYQQAVVFDTTAPVAVESYLFNVADSNVKVASNNNILLQGTGKLRHANRTLALPWSAFQAFHNTAAITNADLYATAPEGVTAVQSEFVNISTMAWIPLHETQRIVSVAVTVDPVVNTVVALEKYNASTQVTTTVNSTVVTAGAANVTHTFSALNYTLGANEAYQIRVNPQVAGNSGVVSAIVTFDGGA